MTFMLHTDQWCLAEGLLHDIRLPPTSQRYNDLFRVNMSPRLTCERATGHLRARHGPPACARCRGHTSPQRRAHVRDVNGSGRGAYRQVSIRGVPNLVYSTRKVGRCRGGQRALSASKSDTQRPKMLKFNQIVVFGVSSRSSPNNNPY